MIKLQSTKENNHFYQNQIEFGKLFFPNPNWKLGRYPRPLPARQTHLSRLHAELLYNPKDLKALQGLKYQDLNLQQFLPCFVLNNLPEEPELKRNAGR